MLTLFSNAFLSLSILFNKFSLPKISLISSSVKGCFVESFSRVTNVPCLQVLKVDPRDQLPELFISFFLIWSLFRPAEQLPVFDLTV